MYSEHRFHLRELHTDIGTEVIAGLTIFATMGYVLVVVPRMMAEAGLPQGAVLTALVLIFVNSNGAFYAANGKLVVDKDGKVTATEGEIGNVVLKNGIFTGNSALRDGELLVGDASGNYSQITTKGAKLGKVIVAQDGKISGVAAGAITADSTDAVNGSQLKQTYDAIAQNKDAIAQNKDAIGTLNTRVTDVENLAKKHTTVEAGDRKSVV